MNRLSIFRAALMATVLMLASLSAQAAQSRTMAPLAAPAVPCAAYFDINRVLLITAGTIGGAMAASALTGGILIPLYHWFVGGATTAGMGMATGAAMEASAGTVAFKNAMTTLGAVQGGFYAYALYQK